VLFQSSNCMLIRQSPTKRLKTQVLECPPTAELREWLFGAGAAC
jgi:hypothetical protein